MIFAFPILSERLTSYYILVKLKYIALVHLFKLCKILKPEKLIFG